LLEIDKNSVFFLYVYLLIYLLR